MFCVLHFKSIGIPSVNYYAYFKNTIFSNCKQKNSAFIFLHIPSPLSNFRCICRALCLWLLAGWASWWSQRWCLAANIVTVSGGTARILFCSRMAMLVTLFLVLINIFNSVRENAPISSRLNAVDLYLVICIFFVFGKTSPPSLLLSLPSPPSCPAGVRRYPPAAQDQEEASHTDPTQGAGQQACE